MSFKLVVFHESFHPQSELRLISAGFRVLLVGQRLQLNDVLFLNGGRWAEFWVP